MPTKTSFIVVVIILVIIAALSFFAWDSNDGVLFGVPEDTGDSLNPLPGDETGEVPDVLVGEPIRIIRSYENGSHTFSGTVSLPTPCHTLSSDLLVLESFPEQLHLRLTVTAPAP